jgi:hypothetical protein
VKKEKHSRNNKRQWGQLESNENFNATVTSLKSNDRFLDEGDKIRIIVVWCAWSSNNFLCPAAMTEYDNTMSR